MHVTAERETTVLAGVSVQLLYLFAEGELEEGDGAGETRSEATKGETI